MKPDRHGLTPLHYAVESSHVGQCKVLASMTDVIDLCEGPTGTTPLILAASDGHTECVEVLLDAGADVNAGDRWCNTALFKASCYNFTDTVN
jgi:ankyrin repeat protein